MAWQLRKVGKAIPFLPPYFFPSHYSSSGWFSLGNFTTIIELITLKKYPLLLKKLFFTSLCRLLLTRAYAYWLKRGGAKFKNRGYESQSELLLWFLFWRKLSGRIVYDFRLPVRFSHESLYGMSFLWLNSKPQGCKLKISSQNMGCRKVHK